MRDEQKRFNIRIVDRENGEVTNVDAEGYAFLGVSEEDAEMFAASILTGNVDVMQIARLIDCLVEKEPTILQALTALRALNEPTKFLPGLDEARTKTVMELMRNTNGTPASMTLDRPLTISRAETMMDETRAEIFNYEAERREREDEENQL